MKIICKIEGYFEPRPSARADVIYVSAPRRVIRRVTAHEILRGVGESTAHPGLILWYHLVQDPFVAWAIIVNVAQF